MIAALHAPPPLPPPARTCGLAGGSWFLPRLNLGSEFGLFLALTGHRITGADAVHAGVATHFIPSSGLGALRADVSAALSARSHWGRHDATAALALVLNRHAAPLPEFSITTNQLAALKAAFGHASAEEIVKSMHAAARHAAATGDESGAAFFGKAAKSLDRASPTSLRVTLEQMRRGAALPSLAACLTMELRIAMHFMEGAEFYEGVRAQLVDKDGKPQWSPSALAGVSDAAVAAFFSPQRSTAELRLS